WWRSASMWTSRADPFNSPRRAFPRTGWNCKWAVLDLRYDRRSHGVVRTASIDLTAGTVLYPFDVREEEAAVLKRLLAAALACAASFAAHAEEVDPADWDQVLQQAQGQTVYFNAWGGA